MGTSSVICFANATFPVRGEGFLAYFNREFTTVKGSWTLLSNSHRI